MTDSGTVIPRMNSDDRRELVLLAATSVFGQRGYAGTTTDQVAAAAGVSQPYVVRIFGTKEKLFLAVLQRALDLMLSSFHDALAGDNSLPLEKRLGNAYVDLLSDRGLLLSLMHGFILGADPAIGALARTGFLDVYRFLKNEAGFEPQQAYTFLSEGMIINTLIGLRMSDELDSADPTLKADALELLQCALGDKVRLVMQISEADSK
jgi:TetR/AcrR family transcriptional regulator